MSTCLKWGFRSLDCFVCTWNGWCSVHAHFSLSLSSSVRWAAETWGTTFFPVLVKIWKIRPYSSHSNYDCYEQSKGNCSTVNKNSCGHWCIPFLFLEFPRGSDKLIAFAVSILAGHSHCIRVCIGIMSVCVGMSSVRFWHFSSVQCSYFAPRTSGFIFA